MLPPRVAEGSGLSLHGAELRPCRIDAVSFVSVNSEFSSDQKSLTGAAYDLQEIAF